MGCDWRPTRFRGAVWIPKGLAHAHGGVITAVASVGHETYKGVASWFFTGDIEWSDGTKSKASPIAPHALGHDGTEEGAALYNAMHSTLAAYLGRTGNWHDTKRTRDGRCYSWTPRNPKGCETIDEGISRGVRVGVDP